MWKIQVKIEYCCSIPICNIFVDRKMFFLELIRGDADSRADYYRRLFELGALSPNEIRQMDIEVAFTNDKKIMKYLEGVVKFIVEKIIRECKPELKLLNLELKVPKVKYLTYRDAIELLNNHGFHLKEGDDFEPEAERMLCELFEDTIIFTYEWPIELKPFY